MPQCGYPPCTNEATESRGLVIQPEFIGVNLCDEHAAILDRNRTGEEEDFWRWASAMMQAPGSG